MIWPVADKPLNPGDRVIVHAKNHHSHGNRGTIAGVNHTPGVAPRYVVTFSDGRRLSYFRKELLRERT